MKYDYEEKAKDWGKKLWAVIDNEGKYSEGHTEFFKEFNKLRDEAHTLEIANVTMVNHVAPIYDHIASQTYTAHIHYKPLKNAVINYCTGKPVADWKGPPDQHSRSPSPRIPPSRPQSPEPLKKNLEAAIPDEAMRSDQDDSEGESAKPPKKDKALPSTEGMEVFPTKCTKCALRKHGGCHVNPKPSKKNLSACFECNHWKQKCSHSLPRGKKGEDEEDVAPKRRKKLPIQVPAGQPGQFSGELISTCSDIASYFH